MTSHPIDRLRVGLTVLVTIAIWSLLTWQHFHGGVPAHHLLADPELPRISNWSGGVLLPVLTWVLLGLSKRRVMATAAPGIQSVAVGLAAGAAYGAALSVAYFSGHDSITSYLFFGLLPLALLLPVHRPECLLGFVLGMSTGFGAVLPTLFGAIMAAATFVIHRFIGRPLQRLVGLRPGSSPPEAE
jgi:hypothetical protein